MTPTLLHRAYGSARVLAEMIGQRRVPFLPEVELLAMRDRRVRRIVRYAADNIPYYQRQFRQMGIDPREIRTAEDLRWLPLLDKRAVRENLEDFVSTSPAAGGALPLRTSGSTGIPLTVLHDVASVLDNTAHTERERAVVRRALGGKRRSRILRLAYAGSTGDEVRTYLSRHCLLPPAAPHSRASPEDPIERVLEAVERFRPDVVTGNGTFVELVFRHILAGGARIHRPAIVVYHGQAMSEAGRELIESQMGIPVFSRYNAVEALKIGFSCEARGGFHLHSDLTHVRIVDPDGAELPTGQRGEVVVSNLVNRATVLLNYRLGDLAAFSAAACPCGRTLPMLDGIEGRVEEVLILGNGRALHPRAVWSAIKPYPEILQYQLVQRMPQSYEIRLATRDRSAFDRIVPSLTARLRELLGADGFLEASFHQRLDGPSGGKFQVIVPYSQRKSAGETHLPVDDVEGTAGSG